jgi:hypothetical protein
LSIFDDYRRQGQIAQELMMPGGRRKYAARELQKRQERKRQRDESRARFQTAEDREKEMTEEGISILRGREEALAKDEETLEGDISAAASRAAAGAYGRQTGRARGGGMLSALGQVEMDVERGARDLRREASRERSQAAMDRLSFERSTMKTAEQMRTEAGNIEQIARGLRDDSKTLGVLSRSDLTKKVDGYIARMGLNDADAAALRRATDELYETEPWLG